MRAVPLERPPRPPLATTRTVHSGSRFASRPATSPISRQTALTCRRRYRPPRLPVRRAAHCATACASVARARSAAGQCHRQSVIAGRNRKCALRRLRPRAGSCPEKAGVPGIVCPRHNLRQSGRIVTHNRLCEGSGQTHARRTGATTRVGPQGRDLSMKTFRFVWLPVLAVWLAGAFAGTAFAHSCNTGLKRAHCRCEVKIGAAVVSTVENHNECYNQQTQIGKDSPCSNWCEGQWDAGGAFKTAAMAAAGNTQACGNVNLVVNWSAGTKPYTATDRSASAQGGGAPVPATCPPGRTLQNGMCVCN